MAYQSTSIGEHLDFSETPNIDDDALFHLLDSKRLRTAGAKSVKHITFPEYMAPLKLQIFESSTGCTTDVDESHFDDFKSFFGINVTRTTNPSRSLLKPGCIVDFVSNFPELETVTAYHVILRHLIQKFARVSVVVDRKVSFHMAVHLSHCTLPKETLVANLEKALQAVENMNSRRFLVDTISDTSTWLPRDTAVKFIHSMHAGGLLKTWFDGNYAKFSFFQDFS